MKNTLKFTIANNLTELDSLILSIKRFLETSHYPSEVIYKVNLILEEMITNIIKYGYDDYCPCHKIDVKILLQPRDIFITIKDDGKKFDPACHPKINIHLPPEKMKIGGLGIHIVRNITKRISYKRLKNKNIQKINLEISHK